MAMLALALAYGVVSAYVPSLTGHVLVDGGLGIGLGLYICSHPASATIDVLYLDRHQRQRLTSEWSDLVWVGLNLLVLVAGCLVTIAGATRFVG